MSDFSPGDKVLWYRQESRGYGEFFPYRATVVKVGKRVQIEVPLQRGGTKLVWVKASNLRKESN